MNADIPYGHWFKSLPANVPMKATEDGPDAGALAPMWKKLLAQVWLSMGHCNHLQSETAADLSPLNPFFYNFAIQIKQKSWKQKAFDLLLIII